MCDDCAVPSTGLTRRRLLMAGAAVVAGGAALPIGPVAARPVRTSAGTVDILPREAWGADRAPVGPLEAEPDVRFLLVHHTVTGNDYGVDDVPGIIRSFHSFHTGPEKGWPDVAYNFLVDRFGRVWEARAGSLDGPVRGSATGGNQGFDQKCAFIGDHTAAPPTPEAQTAMVSLLAWLADRHGIATDPGSTTTFTSLGSNRHPAGAQVTTATIEGHRSMSHTACPGDAAYSIVTDAFPAAVTRARAPAVPTTTSAPTSTSTTTSTSTSTTARPASTTTSTTTSSTTTSAAGRDVAIDVDAGGGSEFPSLVIGGGTLAAAGAALAVLVRRRLR